MQRMTEPGDVVPIHGVRELLARDGGTTFIGYMTRSEAERDPDAAVILSGDSGGTVLLTAPLRLVVCDTDTLRTLVSDLDAVTWMSGDPTCATVAFERYPVGTGVWGGDGGGIVVDGVWTHPERLPVDVRDQAVEVVLGRRDRIDGALLRSCRELELQRITTDRETAPLGPNSLHPDGVPWDVDIGPPAVDFPD
jgi:hypothetical protein